MRALLTPARWVAGLSLLGLALLSNPAAADPLPPNNNSQPALVRGGAEGGPWYAIPQGGALTFDVMGPATLTVDIIQRLPTDQDGPTGQIRAKGDGVNILTIKADGKLGTGSLMDGKGGSPSVVSTATINVPPGQHVFSLEPTKGSLPMLARVDAPASAIVAPSVAQAPEPTVGTTDRKEPKPVEEEPAVAAASEPTVGTTDRKEPKAPEPAAEEKSAPTEPAVGTTDRKEPKPEPEPAVVEPEPTPTPTVTPPPSNSTGGMGSAVSTADEPPLWFGFRTGLGSTRAGNQASWYLGLDLLYKVDVPNVHLGARLGRYGVGLEQEIAIQPPIGGTATAQTVDWTTRVRPLELGARYTVPGSVADFYGWAALAGYSSTRLQGDDKLRGVSVGTSWALGLDLDVGPGVLSPELAMNLGSRSFGNVDPQGDEARERLSGSRINIAYRFAF